MSETKNRNDSVSSVRTEDEELRAVNQQLTASQQQLRAANQQLTASQQQLRAANQQLRSSNQELLSANRQILQERDQASTYLRLAGVMFVAIDINGIVTLINKKGAEILGYPEEEITGKNWFESFVPPEISKSVYGVFEKMMSGDVELAEYYDNPVVRRDGSRRMIAWHNILLRDSEGKPCGSLSSGEDVTEKREMELEIRENEQTFRNISELLSDYAFKAELDGKGGMRMVWTTANFGSITGRSKEEIQASSSWADIFVPEDRPKLTVAMKKIITGTTEQSFEARSFVKNGVVRWVHVTVKAVIDDAGTTAIIGAVVDISARKEAERINTEVRNLGIKLNSASDLKSGLAMCLECGMLVSGTDCGGIYLVNDNRCLDLSVVKNLSDGFIEVTKHYEPDTPSAILVQKSKPIYVRYETIMSAGDDVRRRENLRAIAVVPILDKGRVVAVLNLASHSFDDIPETARNAIESVAFQVGSAISRLKAEESLRKEHEIVTGITQSSPLGIVIVNKEGVLTFANPAAEKTLGISRLEEGLRTYNDSMWKITAPDGTELPDENLPFRIVMKTSRPVYDLRHAITHPDGRRIQLSIYAAPLFGSDTNVEGLVAIIQDITDRLKAEQDLVNRQRLESLGILAGGIAHDFNNLLSGVFGYVDMARKYCSIDPDAARYLEIAMQAFNRARDLTRQLLTFSKGGAPIRMAVNIENVIREAAGLSLSGSNTICEFEIEPDLKTVNVDEGQINQVISNLVINARQAMANGGKIRITAKKYIAAPGGKLPQITGEYIEVAVIDYGTGIPPEHMTKIFDPFFTTKQQGSGLGLSISYSIIKKHDGFIMANSEPCKGTTFLVYLPVASEPPVSMNETGFLKISRGGTVLVMDDEVLIRSMATEMLGRLGYKADVCSSGEEAIVMYQKSLSCKCRYNAVILDLTVPGGMGGEEAMKRILQIDPSAVGIVSSGYADNPVLSKYGEHGFAGAVAKPYKLRGLSEALDKAISGRINDPA
jgi:PAS domain S-box-containing protein